MFWFCLCGKKICNFNLYKLLLKSTFDIRHFPRVRVSCSFKGVNISVKSKDRGLIDHLLDKKIWNHKVTTFCTYGRKKCIYCSSIFNLMQMIHLVSLLCIYILTETDHNGEFWQKTEHLPIAVHLVKWSRALLDTQYGNNSGN